MSDLARYDVQEYGVAEPVAHTPDGGRGPLPDYTGIDLTALRARVDHPVLGAVLATLLARSCHPDGGLVAYHEDSPGAER
ncbi:YxD-tail cyclophane-containing RiPP peptide [Streptomyces sp. NPDC001073]